MEKILVPVDFSSNSINALEYAIKLANITNAELHLLHCYNISAQPGLFVSTQNKMKSYAKDDLKELSRQFQKEMNNGKVIQTHFVRDYAAEGTANIAKKYKVDLIVMGTKGASAVKGALWGSNTSRLINLTSVPVLAVPKYYLEFKLDHILLMIDNPAYKNKKVLDPLFKIKNSFNAQVTAFNMVAPIYVEVDDDTEVLKVSDLIEEVSENYHQSLDGNLKKSIIKYTMDEDVDMLCMIKKDRGFFIELMHFSATNKIVFDSPVPVLVLHEN